MERLHIDLVKVSVTVPKSVTLHQRYVLSVTDVFSRYLWLRTISWKVPGRVVAALQSLSWDLGTLVVLQCDNSGEFKAAQVITVRDCHTVVRAGMHMLCRITNS